MRYVVFFLVLALATTVVADDLSYSTMTTVLTNGAETHPNIPITSRTDALTAYTSEAAFDAACPGLTTEDFSSTLVPVDDISSDFGAINYDTDNSLFAYQSIAEGISLWGEYADMTVVITPPKLGVTSVVCGPNSFEDNAVFTFSEPTNAFCTYIVQPITASTVDIEVFGASGSLGTIYTSGSLGSGTFFGVSCDTEAITSMVFVAAPDAGELFSEIKFGSITSLSRTTWAGVKNSF